jgi:hypothetical protein
LLALSSTNGISNDNDKINPTDSEGLTGHSISGWALRRAAVGALVDMNSPRTRCCSGTFVPRGKRRKNHNARTTKCVIDV